MKKNFFKKLALVMALAVTVTSVPATNASAAAAPTFKSKAININVGQTKKYSTANSAKYSVKFKIGNTKVATIKYSAGSKSVKVTGVASGKSTLRADFKSKSTKKTTTVKVPVTVKEEITTIKSVEAAGVKKVVVTFNKAVDKEKAVVTIKKGSASPSVTSTTFAEDMKSVSINMGSKLTEGTYDVSVSGLTEAALAGSVTVKDETLTSMEIMGTNLVADVDSAAKASIGFKTLNQYGERMSVNTPSASSSFGTTTVKDCTTTANGSVEIAISSTTLQIIGTTGTIVLVQPTTGISVTATITYSAAATAKTMTVAGLYNTSEEKIQDMTAGDTVSDYEILATIEDQYGNAIAASKLTAITATLAPNAGVTSTGTWKDVTVDGKDYVALPLVAANEKATAGTFNVTFVNPKAGLLANQSFTVGTGSVIKTLSITANDSIFDKQKNELAFEAVDAEGNAITTYSKLKDLVTFTISEGTVAFEKQANGSAKLFFTPAVKSLVDKEGVKTSTVTSFTASANPLTSTNYIVKPLTFTVHAKKMPKAVTGIKSTVATAMATATGASIDINASDLVIEDQYSNVMTDVAIGSITTEEVKDPKFAVKKEATDKKFVVSPIQIKSETQEMKIKFGITEDAGKTMLEKSTTEITVSTVDTNKASDLKISAIKDGNVVKTAEASGLGVGNINVTGKVSGKTVKIPDSQFVISGNTGYNIGTATASNPAQTVTGTLEVTVDTKNGPVVITKDYSFSNASPTLTKLEDKSDIMLPINATLTKAHFATLFNMKDQYGEDISDAGVKYDVTDVSGGKEATKIVIKHNATNSVEVSGHVAGDSIIITASKGTLSDSFTATFK